MRQRLDDQSFYLISMLIIKLLLIVFVLFVFIPHILSFFFLMRILVRYHHLISILTSGQTNQQNMYFGTNHLNNPNMWFGFFTFGALKLYMYICQKKVNPKLLRDIKGGTDMHHDTNFVSKIGLNTMWFYDYAIVWDLFR